MTMKPFIAATAAFVLLAGNAEAKPISVRTKAFAVTMAVDQPPVEILRFGALVLSAECGPGQNFDEARLALRSTSGAWTFPQDQNFDRQHPEPPPIFIVQPNEAGTVAVAQGAFVPLDGFEMFTATSSHGAIWAEGGEVLIVENFAAWIDDAGCKMTAVVTTFRQPAPAF
jgi:hypothetical protein